MQTVQYDQEEIRLDAQTGPEFSGNVTVTPPLASAWLRLVEPRKQRELRPRRVRHFANLINRDEYINDGTPVRFDVAGNLIDGQHRLAACVQANRPIVVDVRRGVATEAVQVLDSPMRRRQADYLRMAGFDATNPGIFTNAIVWIVRHDADSMNGAGQEYPTTGQLIDYARKHGSDLERDYGYLMPIMRQSTLRRLSFGAILATYHLIRREQKPESIDTLNRFFWEVLTGLELREGSPEALLRIRLERWAQPGATDRPKPAHRIGTWIRAWNARKTGEAKTSIREVTGKDPFPTIK
jgi:hypothetical protein